MLRCLLASHPPGDLKGLSRNFDMTKNRLIVGTEDESESGQFVLKKKRDGPILMHISVKQYELMQQSM